MPRRALSAVTVLLLSFAAIFVVPTAFASVKDGSVCTKVNEKVRSAGIVYTCTQAGKKIVWRKSIANRVLAPSIYLPPLPNSNDPISWGNLLAKSADVPQRAWEYAQSVISENNNLPGANARLLITRSPHLGSGFYTDAQLWITRVNALYARYTRPPMTYLFFTDPRDLDWTSKKSAELVPFGDALTPYAMYDGGSFSKSVDCTGPSPARAYNIVANASHGFVAVVLGGSCIGGELNNEDSVTHEYTHQIQAAIMPNGNHHLYEPCWMTEGQASWTAAAEYTNFAGYGSTMHLFPYYLSQTGSDYADPGIKTWTKQMILDYYKEANLPGSCWKTNRFALSYSLGSATVEALVAIGGAESHMAFEAYLATGVGVEKSFQAVYGIPWGQAAPILAEYVANRITKMITEAEQNAKFDDAKLPSTSRTYSAQDSTSTYRISDEEGCSNPGNETKGEILTRAVLQAQINGEWIDVPSIDSGWTQDQNCSSPNLGEKNFKPWVIAHMDNGTAMRWRYAGEVNIFAHDEAGFGISHTYIFNSTTAARM